MGIRHLEKFMKENVPNGFDEVSIIDECRKYQREHNEKPTLVFDLMSMTSLLNRDKVEVLYGGRSGKYWQMIDKLFKNLSSVAQLVFFSDGAVVPTKYETWLKRQENRYPQFIRILDLVYAGTPIEEIINSSNDYEIPSLSINSRIIRRLAKSYGTMTVSVTTECDTEIAKYASENPSVLAILSDDTDFLIFSGHWRYFSIRELNLETLKTKEFSRTALRRHLELDDFQLAILATIAGNDFIKYEEVRWVHQNNFGHQAAVKFPAIATVVRFEISKDNYEDMLYNLARFLLNDTSDSAAERIEESINQYNVDFEIHDDVDDKEDSDILQFCRRNNYTFVYEILSKMAKNSSLYYHDFRRDDWPDFPVIRIELFKRNVGIILKHRRQTRNREPILCEFYTKTSHEGKYHQIFVKPNYPEFEFPSLLQLLNRQAFPELDEVRFKLVKWSISGTLNNVNLTRITSRYLSNVLSLYLMVEENFISIKEADLILLSVKNVELNTIPDDLIFPPVVDERAFRIVFLFLKFFSAVAAAIKTSGLKHLRYPANIDGVFFHKTYIDFMNSNKNPAPLLKDIDHCRIYKNL